MPAERQSLQDLIRSRQRSGFVGRRGELVQYQENLSLSADDERRRFLFNIHGDAGVGKTYLTKQLRQMAAENSYLTAYVDETVDDVVSAMAAIAGEFSRGGARLGEFEKRSAAYRERRHALESDPDAPAGIATFITKTAIVVGLAAARDIPVAGSLLAPVDASAAADQADRARAYLTRKFSDHADVRLVLSPADELTPVFVAEIERVAAGRPVALFFDTYERTGPLLDSWLRRLYGGQYGDLPPTLVTTISGQHPLSPNLWGDYLPVIADVPLEPFSDAEARQFLASKNINDEAITEVILTLSGRLPMWLATLAEARPADAADIGDPAGNAVERFLKWEDAPARRAIAMTAALPRTVNQDILAVITGPDQAPGLFGWLCGLPFVTRQSEAWAYHQVVRTAMLRLQLAQAPSQWRTNHTSLADANARWARETTDSISKPWTNTRWIDHTREETYHLLCAEPAANLPKALASAVMAAEQSTTRARQWAELIVDAGRDTDDATLRRWGQRLHNGINDGDLTSYLTHLINDAHLDKTTLAIALEERGESCRMAGRNDQAIVDFNRAIELNPSGAWALAYRGEIYRLMERYDDALTDFNRAIELNPSHAWAIGSRGQTYQAMQRYDDALTDLNHAIELNPSYDWVIGGRGETYWLMERYADALTDFNRAIELNPSYAWALAHRGETYLTMERYDDALTDLNRAIELNPSYDWAIAYRGQTYQAMERYDDALTDFNRAIELNPRLDWAIGSRGQTYQAMERYNDALTDFNRAIELDPSDAEYFGLRSGLYRLTRRPDEALADLNHAIELDPKYKPRSA
jgi:tetratricopeptide (TPR) repeat protein